MNVIRRVGPKTLRISNVRRPQAIGMGASGAILDVLAQQSQDLERLRAVLSGEISGLQAGVARLESHGDSAKADLASAMARSRAEVRSDLETAMASQRVELLREMEQLYDAKSQALVDELSAVKGQVADLGSQVADLGNMVADVNSGLAEVGSKVEALGSEVRRLRTRVSDIESVQRSQQAAARVGLGSAMLARPGELSRGVGFTERSSDARLPSPSAQ